MKRIAILGSTGSIGVNALNVIREFKDLFSVFALTVNSKIDLLEKQILEFNPKVVVVKDKVKAEELRKRIGNKCEVLSGDEGLIKIASANDYEILLTALVGFAGLAPTVEGIKKRKRIALANKETLVVAGELIVELCKKYNTEIIPVDSEHSAIFQVLVGENQKEINKLILTASGGPFREFSKNELMNVTVEQALKHPNWSMGSKITIDSATMMNKGLEVIEAHWLFHLPKEKIEVIVHPQSIIHSMVEFIDGSIKAQLSLPDMKLPIQYSFTYPQRLKCSYEETNFAKLQNLSFYEPDLVKFECLKLAYDVMESGGTAPCILNAANEIAVERFLRKEIKFLEIADTIKLALDKIENHKSSNMETIFECDRQTREFLSSNM